MKERPILFQGAMVRALLAGTKTQTRRLVKPQPAPCDHKPWPGDYTPNWVVDVDGLHCAQCGNGHRLDRGSASGVSGIRCPYGLAGDRLWVRETFMGWYNNSDRSFSHVAAYRAGGYELEPGERWKPAIHMPRAACRILLEVTSVRVERLQAISHADAQAEGIVHCPPVGWHTEEGRHFHALDPRQSYFSLWEAINGRGSVEANPWVWAVTFSTISPGAAKAPGRQAPRGADASFAGGI